MKNKKKTLRDILYYDKVYNNPRSDKQDKGIDDDAIKSANDKTLYDATREKTDVVKRMINPITRIGIRSTRNLINQRSRNQKRDEGKFLISFQDHHLGLVWRVII